MPKPYRLSFARPLPPDAEIVQHDGRPHLRLKERGRSVLYPLSKDGAKYLRPSKVWYFDVRDANGTVRRRKGFTDLKATEAAAAEAERRAARQRAGIIDAAEEHARRPLADHLRDYAAALDAKGNVARHTQQTVAHIDRLLQGCGFCFLRDVDAGKAADWLTSFRRAAVVEIPEGDEFTPAEVRELLGITRDALAKAIARHRLPATGNGKARRLPRATVEALALHRAKGASPETINHYVRSVRGFFRWLVRARRIGANPLESLALVNAAVDVRRARRELAADELRRLFDAARTSTRTFRGLAGPDRYMLYLTAAGTGFRASALANLTPADFDLTRGRPSRRCPHG